ncbi:MAG: Rhomboid family protein [Chitinophagaceae bacterium]|nr:Rhomboid family protein [Chitinophagaceae bacterium]
MIPVSMTLLLIGIISAFTFVAFNNRRLFDAWILYPYRMEEKKEYYRFLTSGLIHSNITHWLFNMFAFYFSASNLESSIGSFHMAAILILGIVLSDLPTFVKHRNNRGYRSLGASGGVSAIIFASIMLHPLDRMLGGMPAFIFAILYLLYSYYQSRSESGDNINHGAHFYGAVIGIAYILVLNPFTLITFFEQLLSWRIF